MECRGDRRGRDIGETWLTGPRLKCALPAGAPLPTDVPATLTVAGLKASTVTDVFRPGLGVAAELGEWR